MDVLKRTALSILQKTSDEQEALSLPPSLDAISLVERYLSENPYRLVQIKSIDRQGVKTITDIKNGIIATGSGDVFDHGKLKDTNTVFVLGSAEYTGVGSFRSFLAEVVNENTVHS